MKKVKVQVNDRGFLFIHFFHGSHERNELKIWVNRDIPISPEGELEFPLSGKITKTEKGSFVLVPDSSGTVYIYEVASGYRGSSNVEAVLSGGHIVSKISKLHSQTGSLGGTSIAFINGIGPVEVRWYRSGRRVSQNTGIHRLTSDGEIEEVIDDQEVCNLL